MEYEPVIQNTLDEIEQRIEENIRPDELARDAGYSVYHFGRIFMKLTGMPLKSYITRRKLAYALYDLSQGEKIIDAAMHYGFETHAGFTKAFKKHFGCPPSLYRMHLPAILSPHPTIAEIRQKQGGSNMEAAIREIVPFTIAGYTSRHHLPKVSGIADIPVFWEKINIEYGAALSTLHNTYTKSHHCEVSVCFDVDTENDYFTYMMGVGVDAADKDVPLRPGVYPYTIQGGLYAVFTTPLVDDSEYTQSIQDTWKKILTQWLPSSEYEMDAERDAYEYYDERDHDWLHDGKCQMDICVPIRLRTK